MLQRLILADKQSSLRMHTPTTESGSSSAPTKSSQRYLNLKESRTMTVIEIRPHRWGWTVFEAPGVEPVFLDQEQANDYATCRACFRSGEIRVLDSNGQIERIIAFSEAD